MMKRIFSILLLSFILLSLFVLNSTAQQNSASNINKVISDDKVIISYDINSTGAKFFDVVIMLTHKNKQIKANSMYGDFGNKISPGSEKSVVWYFKNDFKETIQEVQIDVFASPMSEPKAIFEIISYSNNKYAPCEVTVINKSVNASEFRWDFGDPSSGMQNQSTEKEPRHKYNSGGTYTITLTARNPVQNSENTFYQSFEILEHASVVANFEFEISLGKPPYEVTFRNSSENSDVFEWNFGDRGASEKNNTSKKPSPSYKYKQAGTYTVTLNAKNSANGLSNTIQKEVAIKLPESPSAGFNYTLTNESAPTVAVFKNTSTNATEWQWNFGDNSSGSQNISSEENPVHTYSAPGKFNVTLTASNPQSGKSGKYAAIVSVAEPPKPPVANFRIENNNQIGPVTVVFTNSSTNSDKYIWDFGDLDSGANNTSIEESPMHSYKKPGKYTVILKATNTVLNSSDIFTSQVNVIEATKNPVAGFYVETYNTESPATVKFTNSSTSANNYIWDFGDPSSGKNNISSEANPSHTFIKAGQYKVILSASNTQTKAVSRFSENIVVTEPPKKPVAKFEMNSAVITAPGTIIFTNTSENSDSYHWNFGDSSAGSQNNSSEKNPKYTYLRPGQYQITLVSSVKATGKTNEITKTVSVKEPVLNPEANFTFTTFGEGAPLEVVFKNSTSNANIYTWDFGDPSSGKNNISSEANPSHTFIKAGQYKVTLSASNTQTKAVSRFSENIVVTEPPKKPVANFEMNSTVITAPGTIIFTNTSENSDSYHWNFGDSSAGSQNNSSEKNPKYTYIRPGQYQITLVSSVKATGKTNEITKTVSVKEPVLNPEANFTFTVAGESAPVEVVFENSSINADKFTWDFGDSKSNRNQSNENNPSHKYETEGNFTISLEARNSKTGKKHSVSKEISVSKNYPTFVKGFGKEGNNEVAAKVIKDPDGGFVVLINEDKNGSAIKKLDVEGSEINEKKFKSNFQDIIFNAEKNSYIVSGNLSKSELFVQFADKKLNSANPSLVHNNLIYPEATFTTNYLSINSNGETGLAANLETADSPVDIWFQKADKNGQPIAPQVKVFRYIGKKTVRNVIPFDDGFMITGSWKENQNTPTLMMTGFIDTKGKGEIHVMKSSVNMSGCDVVSMPNGSISVLAMEESASESSISNLRLKNMARDCTPLACEIAFPEKTKSSDMLKFPPRVLLNENGFIILGSSFNGTDSNIMLYWVDKTGTTLIRKEEFKKEGDQFGTSFIQTEDGSLIIVGTERINNDLNALIIKTDPLGKIKSSTNY